MSNRLGLSGQIAKRFLTTEITPLLALVGLLLCLAARREGAFPRATVLVGAPAGGVPSMV